MGCNIEELTLDKLFTLNEDNNFFEKVISFDIFSC